MNQTKLGSLIETIINTIIGFLVSFLVWPFAAWVNVVSYNTEQHAGIVFIFTIASVIRGYVIRRYFNQKLHNASLKLAEKIW